jgi:hypothetical protein
LTLLRTAWQASAAGEVVNMTRIAGFLLLLIGISAATPAAAIPAPMSSEELVQASDVVALVRVVAVTCVAVATSERTGEKLPSYRAELEIVEISKGELQPGDTIEVAFQAIETGLVGPWTVWYYPGEEVWTHLRQGDGVYETTWWNARGEPLREAGITDLPVTAGETVRAP